MTMFDVNVELAMEAAEELGVELSRKAAENIVTLITGNLENAHIPIDPVPQRERGNSTESLQAEIDRLQRELSVYRRNVMERQRCSQVWIDGDRVKCGN